MYLRRVEDNEDFYNDPSNERWYDYEEKTESGIYLPSASKEKPQIAEVVEKSI